MNSIIVQYNNSFNNKMQQEEKKKKTQHVATEKQHTSSAGFFYNWNNPNLIPKSLIVVAGNTYNSSPPRCLSVDVAIGRRLSELSALK